jgi:hypothetical protein
VFGLEHPRIGSLSKGRLKSQWPINGNEKMRCPQCRNTGIASLSQSEDAQIPTVHGIPDGFIVVQTEYGPDFHCGTCNIPTAL